MGGISQKNVRKVMRIKKLRARKQTAERKRNRLSLIRAKKKLTNEELSAQEHEQLVAEAIECNDLGEEIRRKS